ncbi:hypothetical protein C8F01DRAFT_574246 [Mycena amicta]|nr:hypothetical protein C8F01DRAFT_574246 [Mycena amicta]
MARPRPRPMTRAGYEGAVPVPRGLTTMKTETRARRRRRRRRRRVMGRETRRMKTKTKTRVLPVHNTVCDHPQEHLLVPIRINDLRRPCLRLRVWDTSTSTNLSSSDRRRAMAMDMGGPSEDHRRQDTHHCRMSPYTHTLTLTADIRLCCVSQTVPSPVVAVDASSSSPFASSMASDSNRPGTSSGRPLTGTRPSTAMAEDDQRFRAVQAYVCRRYPLSSLQQRLGVALGPRRLTMHIRIPMGSESGIRIRIRIPTAARRLLGSSATTFESE